MLPFFTSPPIIFFLQNLSLDFSEWVEEADKQKSGGLCDAEKQSHMPHYKYSFYNAEAQVQYREDSTARFSMEKVFFADLWRE